MREAFLEVGALFEERWTGIPNVVAAIAGRAINDGDIPWRFIYDTIEIPKEIICQFLSNRTGFGGLKLLADLAWERREVARSTAENAIAVFPNIKPVQNYFHKEAVIIHDLSPIITPQFHNFDNIAHFAYRIRADIERSDHVFCVSQSTRDDVKYYFQIPDERLSVIRLGVDIRASDITTARIASEGISPAPYIAVIGTLEPRKNGRILMDYLTLDPGYLLRYDIVFIGRDGWLEERSRLMKLASTAGADVSRIHFSGFVSETEKIALMLNSRFCVYPSFFEGFGLPVLEAAALGKTTVCSNSSSMPEVAPESCVFFDPLDVFQFGEALSIAEKRAAQSRSTRRAATDIISNSTNFGWDSCYSSIRQWAVEQ